MEHRIMTKGYTYREAPSTGYYPDSRKFGGDTRDGMIPVLGVYPRMNRETGCMTLPKDRFIVDGDGGRVRILDGTDHTDRCLLFVSVTGSYMGTVGIDRRGTTGTVLKTAVGRDVRIPELLAAVLVESGQSVTFASISHAGGCSVGHDGDSRMFRFTWDGEHIRDSVEHVRSYTRRW